MLGLEAANGLLQRGMRVTVVNRANHILNKQLDEHAGAMLQAELEAKGVQFCLGLSIKSIVNEDENIAGVVLDDGRELPADLLVMATGIVPNIALAKAAGLDCERGIIVRDNMQTSDDRVYAVGECVQHRGELFGLVAPVYEQAKVCAQILAGQGNVVYRSITPATMLKVSGIKLFSMGDYQGDEEADTLQLIDHARRLYRKIVLRQNKIVGMLMYGDTSDSAWYQQLMHDKTDISQMREALIFGRAVHSEAA
nr:FAD-dependent oxidoreductase [Methylomarinum sp. Ch1-1]MDP4522425.1 FAD-dependent oxidoreductase [Methylomarinum sp. Ch1-1]